MLASSYETPAQVHAFRQLGADAVGMSNVADVIVATYNSLKVAAIFITCNFAARLVQEPPNHEEVLEYAELAIARLTGLLSQLLTTL